MVKNRFLLLTVVVAAVVAAVVVVGLRQCSGGGGFEPSWEAFPVRGIDISAHNGDVDFEAVRSAGYRFVIIKATEGSSFKDSRFAANISRARRAGLKVGAYHFFRFDATGYMQWLNFLHSLRGQKLDLPVVIDIEQWTNPEYRTTPRVVATLKSLIYRLEREGHQVMLYTNKDGYEEFVSGRLDDYPLWICSFSPLPSGMHWDFWQYTHRGGVDGISGRVDLNVWNGTLEEWEKLYAKHGGDTQ